MPGAPVEFAGFSDPAYKLNPINAGSGEMWNLYPELLERGPRAGKYRMRRIPGMKRFTTLPGSPMRGLLSVDSGNSLFAVCEDKVYELKADGTFAAFTGSVSLNNHPAIMTTNGFQLAIASGGQLYIAQHVPAPGSVEPATFTDGTPIRAGTVDFIDQYFVVDIVDSKQVFLSNLAPHGEIWDPGDTAFKEGYPDNIARVFCDNEIMWLFGFDTTEPWGDNGGLFPFGRINQLVLKIGCSAPYSVAGIGGYRFWLWRGVVYSAYGLDPQPVSDYGVEEAIAGYGDVSNAEGWCYMIGKKIQYCITFPSVNRTWFFDLAAKAWHQRGLWQGNGYGVYHGRVYARAFNRDLVGDPLTGDIWELDENTHVDAAGLPLRWQRTTDYLTDNMQMLRLNQLTVDCDTGVGLNVQQGQPGYDPQMILKYSNDRGKTYSYDRSASLGQFGKTKTRVIFNQLGSSRIGWTVQISGADPVPMSINTAYVDIGPRVAGR